MGAYDMTATQALYEFFTRFGIPAYPTNSVPDTTEFPWLTYEAKVGNAMDSALSCAVNLYYHTDSEAVPNAKAKEISDAIGLGGKMLLHDEGAIWIKRAEPWLTPLVNEADSAIKQRQLMLSLEFI